MLDLLLRCIRSARLRQVKHGGEFRHAPRASFFVCHHGTRRNKKKQDATVVTSHTLREGVLCVRPHRIPPPVFPPFSYDKTPHPLMGYVKNMSVIKRTRAAYDDVLELWYGQTLNSLRRF